MQTTLAAVDTRFLFLTAGAADAADVNAFMNPALSMATAGDRQNYNTLQAMKGLGIR